MTGLTITTFHHIGSLILGIGAWVLACLAIRAKKTYVSYRFSVGSFILCVFSLELQFLEMSNLVNKEDFSAIADTIRAVNIAAFVLIGVTIILNIMAIINQRK